MRIDRKAFSVYNSIKIVQSTTGGVLMGSRPTIQMVAELAGVSRGTVDRVLNDRPHVHEAVRQRVIDAIEQVRNG